MEELLAKAEGLCQELSDGAYRSILEMSHFPGVTYFGTAVLVTRSPEESLDQLSAYGQALREAGVARIEPAQMLPELNAAQDRLRLTVESRHLDRDGRLIGTSAYRLYGDYREGRAGFSMLELLRVATPKAAQSLLSQAA